MNGENLTTSLPRAEQDRRGVLLGYLRDAVIVVAGMAAALVAWELFAGYMGQYFPPPLPVFENIISNFSDSKYLRGLGLPQGGYLPHLLYTTRTVLVGVLIGFALGTVSGMAAWRWKVAAQIVDPLTTIFGTLPILVAAPFFLLWFGLVAAAQIILVSLYSFLILHVFVLGAIRHVDVKYLENARTLGASDAYTFRHVVMPAAMPEIFGGLRIAFASAWGLACIAELLGARFGVGRVIVSLSAVHDVVSMVAIIVMVGLIAVVVDAILVVIRAYVTRWAASNRRWDQQ